MKNFTQGLLLIAMVFITNTVLSQNCGFDIQRQQLRQNPAYVQAEQESEAQLQNNILFGKKSNTVYTIPVVVHVLHLGETVGTGTNITDAQIQSGIDNLTDFFRGQTANSPVDFQVEFALAQRDPNCNPTTGINRIDASGVPNYSANGVLLQSVGADQNTLKDLSRWPETEYFNIWIVTEIDGNNGGFGIQGYANFYNGWSYEGSVMMYTVFGYDPTNANPSWPLSSPRDNNTVVHEVGHYLHLYHTFQGDGDGSSCPADATVGTDSDGCSDTVPHRRETSTCPSINTCTAGPWVDNNTINNVMSYYSCTDRMTADQRIRSRAVLQNAEIVNSKGDEAPITVTPPATACSNNTATGLYTNSAGIMNVELNNTSYSSGSTSVDAGNIDNSSDCTGLFEIDPNVSNTINATIIGGNAHQLGVWIDWNNDGDFDDISEQQYLADNISGGTTVAVNLTYPSSVTAGSFVRLRLITDIASVYGVASISSSCHSALEHGQGEDYVIYLNSTLSVKENNIEDVIIFEDDQSEKLIVKGQLNSNTQMELYDISGRLITHKVLNETLSTNSMDVSSLSTGIYIVRLFDNAKVKTQKLIIR